MNNVYREVASIVGVFGVMHSKLYDPGFAGLDITVCPDPGTGTNADFHVQRTNIFFEAVDPARFKHV